jgi:glycosyltransferase involved in cell wall biosynthesis
MIKVTIITLAYNQEDYIRQTLDGILMQQADFDFEILIHDDASGDSTPTIINEYQEKHPGIIKPIYEKENKFQKNDFSFVNKMLNQAKGEYIALCEGDDYWTDPLKLQKQVRFMEKHRDYALCFHPVRVFFENGEKADSIYPESKPILTVQELLKRNFIQTNSVLYRRQEYKNMAANIIPGDWYLHLYHAQFGGIGYIDEVMSAYRRHEGGQWWTAASDRKAFWEKHALSHLRLYKELLKMYGSAPENRKIIHSRILEVITGISHIHEAKASMLANEAAKHYPKMAAAGLLAQAKLTQKLQTENDTLTDEMKNRDDTIRHQRDELATIKSSLSWRMTNRANRIIGRKKR